MANASGAKATQFSNGFIGQVVAGLRFAVTGKAPGAGDWFGPGQPMAPAAPPEVAGRRFDYPVSANITYTPKAENNNLGVSFDQLRNLAARGHFAHRLGRAARVSCHQEGDIF